MGVEAVVGVDEGKDVLGEMVGGEKVTELETSSLENGEPKSI